MIDDLVKRLDQIHLDYDLGRVVHGTIREARDRVQALQAQNLRLSGMCYDLTAERERLREAVLQEAMAAVNAKWRSGAADTPDEMRGLALAEAAIFDLIEKPDLTK